ncbi:hypothetical protein V8G54_024188 [Vigna mungo]|uniref:RING-type E3 ubiquitin transferase n=1 Tax=Vigna mungo TaxID=3915 RepID=A0AAQ3N6E1_VIGMU
MPKLHIRTVVVRRRMVVRRRSHQHRFLRWQYHEQEIRGHSNSPSYVIASPYKVPETTNHSRSSSMSIQNAPVAGKMHNISREAFVQDNVPSLIDPYSDRIRRRRRHKLLYSDMRLDIDHMSYEELLELGEWIGNVDKGLLEDIIVRQMRTKTYLLPNDSEGTISKEREFDICIICEDTSLVVFFMY